MSNRLRLDALDQSRSEPITTTHRDWPKFSLEPLVLVYEINIPSRGQKALFSLYYILTGRPLGAALKAAGDRTLEM